MNASDSVYKCTCWIFVTTVKETEVQLCSSSAKLTTSEIIHPQKVYKSSVEKSANLTHFIFPYIESHLMDEGKLQMDGWALRQWRHMRNIFFSEGSILLVKNTVKWKY